MAYEGWALLELMGHRQRVGWVKEEELFGGKLLRIDIPVTEIGAGEQITEYYGCSSIYALRPVSEAIAAEHVKRAGDPRPVQPVNFRLPAATAAPEPDQSEFDHSDEDEEPFG